VALRPRLKAVPVHGADGELVIWPRALRRVYLADPSGSVACLLRLLSEGRHPATELPAAMAAHGFTVTDEQLSEVFAALDDMGVLEDADGDGVLESPIRERHESNLRFFDLFARLDVTSAGMLQALQRSRVLLLGAGGVGSGVLQSLVGLGVGEVSIVDFDIVEPKNLARQFVYGRSALGRPKVLAAADWVAAYSGGTRVVPVQERVDSAAEIERLGRDADIVVCAIDSPPEAPLLVNEACFALGVPMVYGALNYSTLAYWSVDPGRAPCRRCLELYRDAELPYLPTALRQDPFIAVPSVNRATGPVVQLLSGLMSLEIVRYLTGMEPPIAAGIYQVVELADGLVAASAPWDHHPDCPLCGKVTARVPTEVPG
jgi:molybdopterin-synthase adenylyltransferase